jgi:hypothetical protein
MKKGAPKILLALTIISLIVLGGVFINGFIVKNRKINIQSVLGEQSKNIKSIATDLTSPIDLTIQNTIDDAKQTVSQKAIEVEKTIITTLEKEVADFSKSQVDNLKLQICKDWGVITATYAASPR